MGMHIWYDLALSEDAFFAEAIEKITELRRYALTVGFRGARDVPPVGELKIGDDTDLWQPTFTVNQKLGDHREQSISVPATEWVGFMTMPGMGTESAQFGLARYPKTYRVTSGTRRIITVTSQNFDGTVEEDLSPLADPADEIIVGAQGWSSWYGWCKTQYAHRHGLEHFMHCHLALIKILDYANVLGILHRVNDEGDYWESRSADVLVANLRENDRIVAAFVGAIHDQIGGALEETGHVFAAPIAGAPDFEHLEAQGRTMLGDRANLSAKVTSRIVSAVRTVTEIAGDPIFAWPAIDVHDEWPRLVDSIGAIHTLNPNLDLDIVSDHNGISYVRHGKTSRDVFHLVMPYRVCDHLSTALTQLNQQRRRIKLDDEWTYIDARRIERTATGDLLIRP